MVLDGPAHLSNLRRSFQAPGHCSGRLCEFRSRAPYSADNGNCVGYKGNILDTLP